MENQSTGDLPLRKKPTRSREMNSWKIEMLCQNKSVSGWNLPQVSVDLRQIIMIIFLTVTLRALYTIIILSYFKLVITFKKSVYKIDKVIKSFKSRHTYVLYRNIVNWNFSGAKMLYSENLLEPKSCRCFFEKWHFRHLPDKHSWNIKVINLLLLCAS